MASDTRPTPYEAALAAFQAEIPRIKKDAAAIVQGEKDGRKFTYGYKYADLGAITAIAMPVLGRHGLSFTSFPKLTENGFVLHYRLRHASGYGDDGEWPLPDPIRTRPQVLGSALTYARRYAFCAATGIAPDEEDDDAGEAQQNWHAPGDVHAAADKAYMPETRPDGSATEAEQARMNRGPVPGVQRSNGTPPDDRWYDTPRTDTTPREELPGTASRDQLNRIFGLFDRLGYGKDDRDGRLALTREITGRPIESSGQLSYVEADRLVKALDERLKGVAAVGGGDA